MRPWRWLLPGAVVAAVLLLPRRASARFRLPGKVALVTGGSRGLGLLIARELAREGARVGICARDAGELREALADPALASAPRMAVTCDVSDRRQLEEAVDHVERALGPVDVLVNVAGVIQVGPDAVMTDDDYRRAQGVMFWGVLHGIHAVAPSMKRRGGGRIVNVTSIGGEVPVPHLAPYVAARFAAVGISETLGAELAPHGVRVTTIVPGLMRTGSHLQALFKGRRRAEMAWFTAGATLPLVSMDARRAARRIVKALRRGEPYVTLGAPARLARLFHAVAPGAFVRTMGVVARVLPGPAPGPARRGGSVSRAIARFPAFVLGRRAAERNLEDRTWRE